MKVSHYSRPIYLSLCSDERTPKGLASLCDRPFHACKRLAGKVGRARKANELKDNPDSEELAAVDLIMKKILPSERLSAELGVWAIKATFELLQLLIK